MEWRVDYAVALNALKEALNLKKNDAKLGALLNAHRIFLSCAYSKPHLGDLGAKGSTSREDGTYVCMYVRSKKYITKSENSFLSV